MEDIDLIIIYHIEIYIDITFIKNIIIYNLNHINIEVMDNNSIFFKE